MIIRKIGGMERPLYRVAAYCRVSTDKREQQESFETQKGYYTQMIASRPSWEMVNIYADVGRSGTRADKRPQFMKMMQDAQAGRLDIILVKSISRFARNAVDCQNYTRELKTHGVEVRFEREGISNMDPSSDFIFSMLAVVAQEESRSISENVRWRYRKNFENGIYHMGNNRILGYDMDTDGKLTPNKDAWIVKMMFERYAEGMNLQEICDELDAVGAKRLRSDKPFTPNTVWRALRNENYIGDLHMQKRAPTDYLTKKPMENVDYITYLVKDEHAAIVGRDIWNAVQERIRAAERDRETGLCRNTTKTHYLYGIVYCAECGEPMLRRTCTNKNKTKYKAWNCRGRQKLKNNCKNPAIRENALLTQITDVLHKQKIELSDKPENVITKNVKRIEVSAGSIQVEIKK